MNPIHKAAYSVVILMLMTQTAMANEYSDLLKSKKYAEVEKLANAKLAGDANNTDALVAKIEVITTLGQEERLDEAKKLAEQCIAAHPQQSECQEALGNVLGTKAILGGVMSALGYAGKIRDAYLKALELDPNNISARFSLLQYYQAAPSFVGGGRGKADGLVTETAKINAEAGKLMQASLDLGDDKISQAETSTLNVKAAGQEKLLDQQENLLMNVGFVYVSKKKYADADRIFHEMQKRFPASSNGSYGLARSLQEQGKHGEAISMYESLLSTQPAANIYYRMAKSWQSLSDKLKAITAFEKALAFKPSNLPKKFRDDAQEQLKALKP